MSHVFIPRVLLLILLAISVAGCEVIGGIFKAGMWVGIILAVIVVALLLWIIGKARS